VPDQDGVRIAAQDLVQSHRIGDQRADLIRAIRRDRGGRVAAHERCHRVETGLGQVRQQTLFTDPDAQWEMTRGEPANQFQAETGPELRAKSSHAQ
jgi:hypothetical protein